MPHFLLADENAYLLKDSPFSQYTSVEASYWLERSAALYKTAEQAIGSLSGNLIVRHTCLGKDLAMTEYDNGTRIYVNYSTEEAAVADGTVAGLSCLRVDKEGTP